MLQCDAGIVDLIHTIGIQIFMIHLAGDILEFVQPKVIVVDLGQGLTGFGSRLALYITNLSLREGIQIGQFRLSGCQ